MRRVRQCKVFLRIAGSWLATLAFTALAGLSVPAAAQSTFDVNYYTIKGTYAGLPGDADFNTIGCCTPTYYDEVLGQLGPNGLPVYNSASAAPLIHDTLASGEITWWSPQFNPNVTLTGTGMVTTPYANYAFYPPNGTGSNDGPNSNFQGAVFSGAFALLSPQAVTFSFGADDDAFLAVDGTIIAQEGGIHGISSAPVTTSMLGLGLHSVQLFYVDRNQTGAGLVFNVDSQNVVVTSPPPPPTITASVPEPAAWGMMIVGIGVIGGAMRRRRRVPRLHASLA